jgi:hypothetical protein
MNAEEAGEAAELCPDFALSEHVGGRRRPPLRLRDRSLLRRAGVM